MHDRNLPPPRVIALAGALMVVVVALGLWFDEGPPPPPVAVFVDAARLEFTATPDAGSIEVFVAASPDAAPPPPPWREGRGVLGNAQTLTAALAEHGVTQAQVHAIVTALEGHYDFRLARPGAAFNVRLRNDDDRLESFRFDHGPLEAYEVVRDADDKLVGRPIEIEVQEETAEVGAEIRDSLYATMQRVGESPALVALIVDVFAWDLDFYRDTHAGDRFRVIVDKVFKGDEFVRYGRVLAAEYAGLAGTFRVFWFEPVPGKPGGYYLEDGRSAHKTFLRTPLKFARISSGFNKSRKHPVLGYNKAHLAIDYAAPTGTPVWAMASGTVKWAGDKGANGNLVVIDHHNGLVSYYAHLHRISRGIKRGAKVSQKRVIGAVGTTGRSTGPHLHFAVKRNGVAINPLKLKMTRGKSVAKSARGRFDAMMKDRVARLARLPVTPAPVDAPEAVEAAARSDDTTEL